MRWSWPQGSNVSVRPARPRTSPASSRPARAGRPRRGPCNATSCASSWADVQTARRRGCSAGSRRTNPTSCGSPTGCTARSSTAGGRCCSPCSTTTPGSWSATGGASARTPWACRPPCTTRSKPTAAPHICTRTTAVPTPAGSWPGRPPSSTSGSPTAGRADTPTDARTERETLRFYVALADRYAGEPMLSALLGTYAARLGDRAAALDLFEKGYGDFVVEPYTITTEYSPTAFPDQPRAGPFTANLGGFLTSCLYGLTGLRLHDGDPPSWFERRIVLPAG